MAKFITLTDSYGKAAAINLDNILFVLPTENGIMIAYNVIGTDKSYPFVLNYKESLEEFFKRSAGS